MLIKNSNTLPYTAVSNAFIDRYMPEANGEFVKVYLYLLRLTQGHTEGESDLAKLADRLTCTENDVLRALRYWEKLGLLSLTMSGGKIQALELSGGLLTSGPEDGPYGSLMPAADAEKHPQMDSGKTEQNQLTYTAAAETAAAEETAAAVQPAPAAAEEAAAAPHPEAKAKKPARIFISEEALNAVQNDMDFKQVLFVAETYLGRTLSAKDIQLFAYLYNELHFSEDLLEYLVEYCVGGGHRSSRYMESVALGWHEEGILSVNAAKEMHRAYSRESKEIMKAMGISGRVLTKDERRMAEYWLKELGMSLDLVVEACGRTMSAIHQPSFEYTGKILESWHKEGITTVEEARAYALARKNARKAAAETPAAQPQAPRNRFQNYQGRDMDYDALLNQGGLNPYQN